jgi:tetratricopeptide (TPR) repeat protein
MRMLTNAVTAAVFVSLTMALATARAQDVLGIDQATGPVATTLVVMGTVELATPGEDKSLPPDLRIAVDCHGNLTDGGGVSLGGRFRFTLTPTALALSSANICVVEAKVLGYESTEAKFSVRSTSGMVNLDVITIQPKGNPQAQIQEHSGKTVSATSLKAPADAVKLFERGTRSLQNQKFADAAKDFESAVKIYPGYAEAWLNLGRARVSLDALAPAREAFLRGAELDPQMAGPPAELGLLAARQNDLTAAARYLDESLRLDPGNSYQTCYSDALVNLVLKRYDVAERSARAALRFGDTPAQARADFVLGMALLARGGNAEAKQRLRRYLELSPAAPEREQVTKELSRLDRLEAGGQGH